MEYNNNRMQIDVFYRYYRPPMPLTEGERKEADNGLKLNMEKNTHIIKDQKGKVELIVLG